MFALHVHSTHLAGVLSPPFLPFSLASSARCCASAAAAALTSFACFCFLAASCLTADRSEPQLHCKAMKAPQGCQEQIRMCS